MTLRDSWHRKERRHEKYIEGEEHENHVRRSQTLSIVSSTSYPRALNIFFTVSSPFTCRPSELSLGKKFCFIPVIA